jgi:hypothetical protein
MPLAWQSRVEGLHEAVTYPSDGCQLNQPVVSKPSTRCVRSSPVATRPHSLQNTCRASPHRPVSLFTKRLRFLIFNTAGRLVRHARGLVLRLTATVEAIALGGRPASCCPWPPEAHWLFFRFLSTDCHASVSRGLGKARPFAFSKRCGVPISSIR